MKYDERVKIVANTNDKSVSDRCDMVIQSMTKVIYDIIEYRWAVEHYEGNTESVLTDKANSIKKSAAMMESNLDILYETLNIGDKVEEKKEERITKMINKLVDK